jgi:hypothetical protein
LHRIINKKDEEYLVQEKEEVNPEEKEQKVAEWSNED